MSNNVYSYSPTGFEQIPLDSEEQWIAEGCLQGNLVEQPECISGLGFDEARFCTVRQNTVRDFMPSEGEIESVFSPNLVGCRGVIVRDDISGECTFGHLMPGERTFEKHMKGRHITKGKAVVVFGSNSSPYSEHLDLRDGDYGNIKTRVISADTGSTWWSLAFKALTNELIIVRQKPTQTLLRYKPFDF